jgi:beta-lactamase superfamily II metal-dependent hydrolase
VTATTWDLPDASLQPDAGTFVAACQAARDHLVYFLLNVGDGDTQLILLPEREEAVSDATGPDRGRTHGRRGIVVDVATTRKLPELLDALAEQGIIDPREDELLPLVVGTHPHSDHIGGMPQFIRRYADRIGQFWEPGYYHPSGGFIETMVALEDHPHIRHLQPTSGTTCFVDAVQITVMTPGIGLRGRFDTYGIAINDASLSIRIDFPATRVAREVDRDGTNENRVYLKLDAPWALLLGGDAQTTAWAQASVDFPELHREHDPGLYRGLREATGRDPLNAHVFKVPHHASKRGLNLELMERVRPRLTLVSSVAGGGRYNFPHPVTVEAMREALEPIGTKSEPHRSPDHDLGIHYTGAHLAGSADRTPAGSVAVLVPPKRGSRLRVWRFLDGPRESIDLDRGRRLTRLH